MAHFVYLVVCQCEHTGLYLGSIDQKPDQQDTHRLSESDSTPQFALASGDGPGSLFYLRGGTLMAGPFDDKRLQFAGAAVRVADDVGTNGSLVGIFSISENGVLATSSGGSGNRGFGLVRPAGQGVVARWRYLARDEMEMSSDGTRVVEGRVDAQGVWAVWVLDLARGTSSRFTFDSTGAGNAIWSPDGKQIVYVSGGGQSARYFRRDANGASKQEVLFHSESIKTPLDWSSDGRWILYVERGKDKAEPVGPAGRQRSGGTGKEPFHTWSLLSAKGKPNFLRMKMGDILFR